MVRHWKMAVLVHNTKAAINFRHSHLQSVLTPLQGCFKNTATFKKPLHVLVHESSFICIDHQLTRELRVLPNINGQVNIHRWKEINSKVQRGL